VIAVSLVPITLLSWRAHGFLGTERYEAFLTPFLVMVSALGLDAMWRAAAPHARSVACC
jgi:hypothetical protein